MPGGRTGATTRPSNGKRGRPSSLSAETVKTFTNALLGLNSIADAARMAGIDPSTAHRWHAAGKKQTRGELRDFYVAVEEAMAKSKGLLVLRVNRGTVNDPKLALKVLQARWPAEWASTRKVEFEDKTPASKREGVRERLLGQLERIEERITQRSVAGIVAATEERDE